MSAASRCLDCSSFSPKDEREGFCKANGPSVQAILLPTRSIQAGGMVPELRVLTLWPSVNHDDWCSKFESAKRIALS